MHKIIFLSIFVLFHVCSVGQDCTSPQIFKTRENFYSLVKINATELLETAWDKWQKYPDNWNAQSWYWGARLAYRRGRYSVALEYLQKTVDAPDCTSSLKKASLLWQAFILKGITAKLEHTDIEPRLQSEIAIILQECGDSHAWEYAHGAVKILEATEASSAIYWENLAITRPPDFQLWEKSLSMALIRKDDMSPFFDPALLESLFIFWEKVPDKRPANDWCTFTPIRCSGGRDGSQMAFSPNEVWLRENEFSISQIRQSLACFFSHVSLYDFCHRYRAILWSLAWLYGNRGFMYNDEKNPCTAHWYWQASASVYDFIFWQSRRGNLEKFDIIGILQMSRVWLALQKYEEMLAYIYTPHTIAPLTQVSILLRPLLQFLQACQVTCSSPIEIPLFDSPRDTIELIFGRAFGSQLETIQN